MISFVLAYTPVAAKSAIKLDHALVVASYPGLPSQLFSQEWKVRGRVCTRLPWQYQHSGAISRSGFTIIWSV